MPVSLDAIRAQFPALAAHPETAFLENAGGSQIPVCVAEAVRGYMIDHYVNAGAGYHLSQNATATIRQAHAFINRFMNGETIGSVILGPSTSALCRMLAGCYRRQLKAGDEIIISQMGHEANVGCWAELAADSDVTVRIWKVDPESMDSPLESLGELLNRRTRVVAVPHVSNILGHVIDIAAITRMVHAAGARIVVDGVAYASHSPIDVEQWGADWYVYSTYKVFGPHMAALFGRHEAMAEVVGPNHYFILPTEAPRKFEVGGACPEGCAGLLALQTYLAFLATGTPMTYGLSEMIDRTMIEQAFAVMQQHEAILPIRLLDYLRSRRGVRIIGPSEPGEHRVGTVSFVHDAIASRHIAETCNAKQIGIRHGHMYSYRLCEALGIEPTDGVIRASMVHYNTTSEIDRLNSSLDEILGSSG